MLVPLLALLSLSLLVLGLLILRAFFQSEKPPRNSPSNYLKLQRSGDGNRNVVVHLGDSITHGRIGVNYVDMIASRLSDGTFEFVNAGKNAELAWNNLQRVEEVIVCRPDIVTVLIGSNDANAVWTKTSKKIYAMRVKIPRNPDIEWYRESLISLVKKLKSETNAKIALLSIPTIGEDPNHPAFKVSTEYSNVVLNVAQELDVAYLPLHERMVDFLKESSGVAVYPYEKYFIGIIKGIFKHYLFRKSWDDIARDSGFSLHVDYLHLNTAGARMVADLVSDFLQSTLTRT